MKPQSMEEKISYRLFFMGFVGLVCTAVLCLFVFHKAFREQAWTSLEHQADLVSAGYEQLMAVWCLNPPLTSRWKTICPARRSSRPCGRV